MEATHITSDPRSGKLGTVNEDDDDDDDNDDVDDDDDDVGVGFEPESPSFQSSCSTALSHVAPLYFKKLIKKSSKQISSF